MYRQLQTLLSGMSPAYEPVIRAYLVGLDAALDDLARRTPGDPGTTEAEALRRDLVALLERSAPVTLRLSDESRSSNELPPETPSVPRLDPAESKLCAEFMADPSVSVHLGQTPVPDVMALMMATLRLPAETAAAWQARVPQNGDGQAEWDDVPSLVQRVTLVPPLQGHPGLRLRPEADLPVDLTTALRLRAGNHSVDYRLAVAAATVLIVGARDPGLIDLLPTRNSLPAGRLTRPPDHATYRAELIRRLRVYAETTSPQARLLALVDIDEALCSVVHQPLAAEGSWWAGLYQSIRDEVFAEEVPGAKVTLLDGRYADLRDKTAENAILPGKEGAVLGCLRLWVSIDGTECPGRVIIGTT
jgi:hypothetical protein